MHACREKGPYHTGSLREALVTLAIFDTLARGKRPFLPRLPGKIGMYVCGMTVYDRCHLGHGRVMVAFDVIVRHLRTLGFGVQYVRNITDVDDKIFARALEREIPFTALTTEMIAAMHADERALNCRLPDAEPRATQHIPQMLDLIARLIEKGAAYQGESGDVYFRVSAFPEYGKLNNRNLEDMVAGARVQVAEDKEHPADFVLWKSAKPGEASWDSRWGAGRPGWHIECSAMSMDLLGTQFDIHGGGPDLKFPHHENEIAQSEAATGCTLANYWMHAGPVRVNDEKMSKSLDNFVTLQALFTRHDPAVIRFFLLQSHYRSAISFSEDALTQAEAAYVRLVQSRSDVPVDAETDVEAIGRYMDAMNDDFNTPRAIAVLFDLAKRTDAAAAATLEFLGDALGLFPKSKAAFLADRQALKAQLTGLSDARIDTLVIERSQARAERDFARADAIRAELTAAGISIEDSPTGTVWTRD